MPCPFSTAGRYEERSRIAEQQRAQLAERMKAITENRAPAEWARDLIK